MSDASKAGQDPEPVRALVTAIDAAVAAARAADLDAFEAAVAGLDHGRARRADGEQVGVLLGLLLADLLERTHPDGIDTEDAEQVIERCLRTSRPWFARIDEDQLIRALAGALRVDTYAGPDAVTVVDRAALTVHGLLLVADLLEVGHESLRPLLDGVLGELRREQAIELP